MNNIVLDIDGDDIAGHVLRDATLPFPVVARVQRGAETVLLGQDAGEPAIVTDDRGGGCTGLAQMRDGAADGCILR